MLPKEIAMSQINITGLFGRGVRRTLDAHGIPRFSIEHIVTMHRTAVQVPLGIQQFVVPIGPLCAFVSSSNKNQVPGSVGGFLKGTLLIDGHPFFKLPDKLDFRLSDKVLFTEDLFDFGNVDVPWTSDGAKEVKKLELQFCDTAEKPVGTISMLLEVEVIRV